MTIKEMQTCTVETLSYFIQTMPDVPFAECDVIIEFVPQKDIVRRYKELCAIYCPEKIINDRQYADLAANVAANALIGREKSAVLVCIDYKQNADNLRRILFHEFMHIFCAKSEMDGEHFIDIYGTGTTSDNPENSMYDGQLASGYEIWEEFIAHYYSFKYTEKAYQLYEVHEMISELLDEVRLEYQISAKGCFSYACAAFLNAKDASEEYRSLREEHHDSQVGGAFYDCLGILYDKLQEDKPWLLTEEFIAELGKKYVLYMTIQSMVN